MELKEVYAPVLDDLEKVKHKLATVQNTEYPWLSRQLKHILSGTGKIIRPALTLLCGQIFTYNLETLIPMASSIELMHTATLVHDDIIDKAATRRGVETINSLWGDEIAILMGDFLFAQAGIMVSETNTVRVIRLFSETLGTISSGEIGQFRGAYYINRDRDSYFRRVYRKTGSLFSLSTQSGAILGQAPENSINVMKDYGDNMGIAFQVVDDILDFASTPEALGKPIGSDLRQGTLTLPAMMVLERYPENNPVQKLFETKDESHAQAAVDIILNSSIIQECYDIAVSYRDRAVNELKTLPDKPGRRSLEKLAEFIINQGK